MSKILMALLVGYTISYASFTIDGETIDSIDKIKAIIAKVKHNYECNAEPKGFIQDGSAITTHYNAQGIYYNVKPRYIRCNTSPAMD